MLDEIQGKYINILKSVNIYDFKDFDLVKLLFNDSWRAINSNYKSTARYILKAIMFPNIEMSIDYVGKFNDLLFITCPYNRRDHDNYWKEFKSLFYDFCDLTVKPKLRNKKIMPNVKKMIYKINKFIKYFSALKQITPIKNRIYLATSLLILNELYEQIKNCELHPKVMVCFFDSGFYENLISQYYKSIGAITITLQHGQPIFRCWDKDRLNQSIILNFTNDYFIANGKFTLNQFVAAGVDLRRIKVLGSLKHIHQKDLNVFHNKLGVFLDAPGYPFAQETNIRLIEIAEQFCKKYNYKYLLKIHPADKVENYKQHIGTQCVEVLDKNSIMEDFADTIDFGILHASAIYIDLLANYTKSYKMRTDFEFPLVEMESDLFSSIDELDNKFTCWRDISNQDKTCYLNDLIKYYLYAENVENRIYSFINNLLV